MPCLFEMTIPETDYLVEEEDEVKKYRLMGI